MGKRACLPAGRGVTLIELIIGIGISVVLVVSVTAFLLLSQRSFSIEQGRAQLILESRQALDEMTRKTKEASKIAAIYTSPLNDTYQTDQDTVVLELPSVDGNNDLIPGSSDYVVFDKSESDLFFLQFPAASSQRSSLTKILTKKVGDYTATYFDSGGTPLSGNFDNAKTVRFTITLVDTIRGKQISTGGEEDATLRNK